MLRGEVGLRRGVGAPGEIRTPDHLVRSQVLYPAELRAQRRFIMRKGAPFVKIVAPKFFLSALLRLYVGKVNCPGLTQALWAIGIPHPFFYVVDPPV